MEDVTNSLQGRVCRTIEEIVAVESENKYDWKVSNRPVLRGLRRVAGTMPR
jgi:hypothetical protein